jgi:hypothetical protein
MPGLDAQTDFLRARRRAALGAMVARLRGEPSDVRLVLPYEEVVAALGYVSEHSAGKAVVALDAIVGSVDRGRDFDRSFRPTTGRMRSRWEHIATAMRRGEAMPPVDLVRVGQIYFVRDGHHRVSVARALGHADIDAMVTEVITRVGAERAITLDELPVKSHERVFFERVPLPDSARTEIELTEDRGEPINRREAAYLWLETEYRPVVEMMRGADLIGTKTDAEAYMRVSAARYRLLRTHTWDEDVLAAVVDELSRKNRRRRVTDAREP